MRKYFIIIIPLVVGLFIYQYADTGTWLRNYIPDGLWAFSFGSAFLLIWKPQPKSIFHLIPLSFFITFELLQKFEIITGTFDLIDCVTYILFYLSASIVYYYYAPKSSF